MFVLWLVLGFACFIAARELEYIVNYDRLELAYYDKSKVKDAYFLFRKYNRTNFCLNTSFVLLEDLDGNHIQCTVSAHQFLSNAYKPMGMEKTFNVCDNVKGNMFGIKDQLRKYGNLEACDIKKGFYYMYNFMPDENYFPKYIPPGSYMVRMDIRTDTGEPVLRFEWYVTAKFKLTRSKPRG